MVWQLGDTSCHVRTDMYVQMYAMAGVTPTLLLVWYVYNCSIIYAVLELRIGILFDNLSYSP